MKKIYSRFDRPVVTDFVFTGKSETQQHFKEDCDVNRILERFLRTGTWTGDPAIKATREPMFGDFAESDLDFRAAQEKLVDADRRFMALPAAIRERFGNNAVKFVEFLQDPANREEAAKMGFLKSAIKETNVIPDAPHLQDPDLGKEVVKEG